MTTAEMAILSLLAEAPRHGYEIEQVLTDRGMRDWTEVGFSSIYYVLKKLQGRGWVESRVETGQTKGPARMVYQATAQGYAALREATYAALSTLEPPSSPFLLGLATLPLLTEEEAAQALATYRRQLTERRAHVVRNQVRNQGAPSFVRAMFDRTLALMDAEMAWLDRFGGQYRQKEAAEMKVATKPMPELVEVPEGLFLTFAGRGEPEGEAFTRACGALYGLAYTLKFKLKVSGQDFKVGALEGLWWADDLTKWDSTPREEWNWKLMIRMPECVTEEQLAEAQQAAMAKKKDPALLEVRFERIAEGLCAQVLHIGPYATERESIDRLHAFVAESGYRLRGDHHEIYLSDPKRTAPEKMKTVLRHPVEKA